MAKILFSVPIFFIVFRETVEAAVIVSVLLGLAKQIVQKSNTPVPTTVTESSDSKQESNEDGPAERARLLKKLKLQIYLGAAAGFITALAIGTAFIVVWFKKASNLWSRSEDLWEAIFQLVAAIMIFCVGVSMLKLERAKAVWRVKLERAFSGKATDRSTRAGRWLLFVLPYITVLREGLEGVVFVSGVALGQPGSSVPIAAIVGIICGLLIGALIYQFASRSTLRIFLIVTTNFLLLIGAGLFSKSVAAFQGHAFNLLLGAEADDGAGTGTGSYDVRGNVWHLDCCSPENGSGWGLFGSIFGWSNNASVGTVLAYVFYWITVMVTLVILKFKEGRTKLFGMESAISKRRREYSEQEVVAAEEKKDTEVVN